MNKALSNIRRSPYQALSAIVVTSLTMFVIAIFVLISLASHQILINFETKPQVIAYLKDTHTPDQANQLINSLTANPVVKKAGYISKQEALEIYKKSVSNDPLLLGTVTDWGVVTADILPASIEITAQTPKDFEEIVSILEKSDIVSTTPQGKKEIDFPKDIISELTKWTNAIRSAGIILVSALTLSSVLTIMIIISMKISSRRSEINTLKLLGAKNMFILRPYLLESTIYGIISAIVGWLATVIVVLYSTPFLASRLTGIIQLPLSTASMGLLLLGLLLMAVFLSLLSGFLAAIRFVRR